MLTEEASDAEDQIQANFIKPYPAIVHIGAQQNQARPKEPKKNRWGHNYRERDRSSLTGWVAWGPVRLLWWTVYSGPRRGISILEVATIIFDNSHLRDEGLGLA